MRPVIARSLEVRSATSIASSASISMRAGLDANGNPTAWGDAIINLDSGTGTAW
jgi:hypothetical protein